MTGQIHLPEPPPAPSQRRAGHIRPTHSGAVLEPTTPPMDFSNALTPLPRTSDAALEARCRRLLDGASGARCRALPNSAG